MTLIITALADDAVVQVSDRRLSRGPNPLSKPENKAVCVSCADATLAVAYTGLARAGTEPMAEWLVNRLASMNASSLELLQITENLRDIATKAFAKPGAAVGLTFVFAGFGPHGPLAATVSNLEDGETSFSAPAREFRCGYLIRNQKRMRKLDLAIHGREDSVTDTIGKIIPRVRRRFFTRSPDERAGILVDLVRRAANHPTVGKYIGKDCMSVIVRPSADFVSRYHPFSKEPIEFAPHLVTGGMAFKQVSFSLPPGWTIKVGPH
jgi:hypothetical protein